MLGAVDIRVCADEQAAAAEAGRLIALRLRDAVRRRGEALLAVSGGPSGPRLFHEVVSHAVPWERVRIWQVDERVAPDGHEARNANQLSIFPAAAKRFPMPVTSSDLRRAAARYATGLPERFDVVHLGLGADGHCASWPPGHDVVASPRAVEAIELFNGYPRMTLTPLVVNAARARIVVTTGASKQPMVERWLLRDPDLPIAHLRRTGTVLVLDEAAISAPTRRGVA
jgi:6-phosphogluconolactonase/glucosamine-6-phosphate isomerase/deaminase